MTDNTTAPGGEEPDELDEILDGYHIVKIGEVGATETSWYELKEELQAYILAAVQKAKPDKKDNAADNINTAEENWRLGYNQGINDFEQAAIARFGKGGTA